MAVRAPDPHNLRNSSRSAGASAIDRECVGCGYNLRGLPVGAKCPECGMAVADAGAMDDPLSLAPTRVIVACIRGCWAASIIIALSVGLMFATRFDGWPDEITHWSLPLLALLWVGAVAWLTPAFGIPQAASRGFTRRGRLRRTARWLQWGWPLAAGAKLLQHQANLTGMSANLTAAAVTIGLLAGLTGVVLLAILLERLSEWARDDTAQNLFNWAAWAIPLSTFLLFVNVPIPIVGLLFVCLWFVSIALFPYALLTLSGSVTLTVVHAYEHRERETRRNERRRDDQEKLTRTVTTMDAERARRGHV